MLRRGPFIALIAALGCDPSPSDPLDGAVVIPDDPETYDEFLLALERAKCEAYAACWDTVVPCEPDVPADVPVPDETGAFPGGRRRYDATRGGECVAAIAADPCAATATVNSGCEGALIGLVEVGGVCVESLDCMPGGHCPAGTCPQRCVAFASEGEACNLIACRPDLACRTDPTGNPTCVVPSAEGGPCGYTFPCAAGLYCVTDASGNNGACRLHDEAAIAREGEACYGPRCVDGLSCVYQRADEPGSGPVCFAPAASGGPCYLAAAPAMCPEGEFCDADPAVAGDRGVCSPWIGADEPCPDWDGCDPSLRCVLQVCRDLGEIGETCSEDLDCESVYCAAARCATRPNCPV